MKTEFEADLRQAFAARAATVPVAGASRLRSMDYRPRERRLRPPVAVGAAVLASAGTAGAVLSVVLGGAAPAYAGWSAAPTAASRLTVCLGGGQLPEPADDDADGARRVESRLGPVGERAHRRARALHGRPVPERRGVRLLLHQLLVHPGQHGLVRRLRGSGGGLNQNLGIAWRVGTRREWRRARWHVKRVVGWWHGLGRPDASDAEPPVDERRPVHARGRSLSEAESPVSRWSSTMARTS